MQLPLEKRIRKRASRDVALLEDVIVRIIYGIDATAELHGGTAIWRCYSGRRFSKDLDIYISSQATWEAFKEKVKGVASLYNAEVLKLKDTGHLIFIELLLNGVYSEIDINYKNYYKEPVKRRYETLDGSFYDVLTLPPEAMILEKIGAYKDRRSITDLYDLRVLIDFAAISKVKANLKAFLTSMVEPEDVKKEEKRLKDLIFEGPVPSFKSLVDSLAEKIS